MISLGSVFVDDFLQKWMDNTDTSIFLYYTNVDEPILQFTCVVACYNVIT